MFTQKCSLIRRFVFILILLSLFSIGTQVFAEQQEPNEQADLFEMSLEDLMEVEVYTASKYKQKITEAPSSVTIVTAEEIRRYGYRTLLDILNSVPGFYKTYDRNYGYIGVRGLGRPGDYNSRIQMLIDGHRINENISDSLWLVNDFYFDVDLIDRIEIIRGPGSSLYGSNALFAVINIITKSGKDYKGLELSSEWGSFDTERGRITYGNTFDNNSVDLLLSVGTFDRDGDTLYYKEFDDPSTNYGNVENDDDRFNNFLVKSSFGDLSFIATHVEREKGIPTAPWGTVFADRGTRTWDTYTLLGLIYQHEFPEELTIKGKLSYNHYNYWGNWMADWGGLYVCKEAWKGRWWIGELQFTKKLSDRHKLVWGAETQYNVRQDQKDFDDWDVYLDDRRHSKSWGMYIQDEFRISDNLILNAGVRQDYYDSFGFTVNPRIGVIYNPYEGTAVKLIFGKAFRAPSAYELYYNDGDNSQKANPNLKPEKIKTYELILEQRVNQNLNGSISAFYNTIENLIDQTTDPGDGLIQFQNLSEEVTAKGFEAALDGKWDNGMRGRIGYSFVRTLDKTNRASLANSPKHMFNFNLIYPLIKEKLFAGIETKWTGKRKTLTNDHIDDTVITNLTLTYENVIKNLEVQVGIYNLFDEKYGHPGFAEHTQDIIYQNGRSFGVRLSYRF